MKKVISKFLWKTGAVLLGVVALAICILSAPPGMKQAFATSTSTTQTINLTVNETISLLLTSTTLNMPALTPGVPVFATSSAQVTTNSSLGFNLQVNRVNTSSTLTSSSIQFPDLLAWNQGAPNATTSAGSDLSFRASNSTGTSAGMYNSAWWGASEASGTAMYAGFPTTTQTFASTSTYTGAAETVIMQIRADAPLTQEATNYQGNIVITALAQP